MDLALERATVLDDAAEHNITTLKNNAKRIAIRMHYDSFGSPASDKRGR